MGILLRYVVLQLPGWGLSAALLWLLHRLADVPAWVAAGVFALIVVKDALLYPLVRRALLAPPVSGAPALVGARARVISRLAPEGTVRVGAELWLAEARTGRWPVEAGETVTVREVQGLRLLVERAEPDPGA